MRGACGKLLAQVASAVSEKPLAQVALAASEKLRT